MKMSVNQAIVLSSLNALLKMELIHSNCDQAGKRYYKINDLLFQEMGRKPINIG